MTCPDMTSRPLLSMAFLIIFVFATVMFRGGPGSFAQDSDGNLELHANSHATARDIGLPNYPGATVYKEHNGHESDSAVDFGVDLGNFHIRLMAAKYLTSDSAAQVLAFYRKPLSRYGEVLECEHGKPIGSLTVTRTGLTCDDQNGKPDPSESHELRAGSPKNYRIVAIDERVANSTRFDLVYLELPKGSDAGDKSK